MSVRSEPISDAQFRAMSALAQGPVFPGHGVTLATARSLDRRGLAYLEQDPAASGHTWVLHRDPPHAPHWEIRERDDGDGSGPSGPFIVPASRLSLVQVLLVAVKLGRTVDIMDGDRYIVSYCGAEPYWWKPGETGAEMHQVSSLGWCNTCLDEYGFYAHHLGVYDEIAVLTETAITDRVLRRQVEADGQTAEQYAGSVAGKRIPKWDDGLRAVLITRGGTFLGPQGLMRQFTVMMRDRSKHLVAVPYDNRSQEYMSGSRDLYAARDLAERLAYDRIRDRKPCYDCRGTRGHAHDCHVTRDAEFEAKYGELLRSGDDEG
jgi:hypothetical protein